jgi:sugar/nucleoside kinase (ribokinase family)
MGIVVADHACTPIPRMPGAGELQMADRLQLAVGGCATNVAVDLSKLGRRVGVVGRVGDDVFGQFVRDSLDRSGVDTAHLLRTPDTDTSGTLIVNVDGEDRRFVHAFGANAAFDGSEVSDELLTSAPLLYLGGYLLLPNLTADVVADLFARARARGVTTVLDVAIPDPTDLWSKLAPILPHTDLFLPNIDEARLITALDDPIAQANRFHEAGARTVVVTCGDEGAVLVGDDGCWRSEVFNVPFIDGTGSGDAFDAGFIHGLLDAQSPEACLTIGSALGASCVRETGATEGVFDRAELATFLKQHPLAVSELP